MDSETAEAHGKLVEKAALSLESASQSQPQGASLLPASTVGAGWTVWCTLVAAIRLIADVILRAYMLYYTPNRNIVPKLGDVWAKKQNGIPELTAFGDTLSYCNSVLRSCRHRCVRPIEQSQAVFSRSRVYAPIYWRSDNLRSDIRVEIGEFCSDVSSRREQMHRVEMLIQKWAVLCSVKAELAKQITACIA